MVLIAYNARISLWKEGVVLPYAVSILYQRHMAERPWNDGSNETIRSSFRALRAEKMAI